MIILRHGGGGLRGEGGNGRRTVRPPVLNSGSGTINGEEGERPWKSKGHVASLLFCQGQAAVCAAPSIAIKTKTRGVTWMVNRTHTVWIIQTFEILKWQLFFQNAFVGCHYSSAPSLKMDIKNTTACRVPLHYSMPSFMNFRWVLDLLEIKNKVSQRFAGNQ